MKPQDISLDKQSLRTYITIHKTTMTKITTYKSSGTKITATTT